MNGVRPSEGARARTIAAALLLAAWPAAAHAQAPFVVTDSSVRQGSFLAVAHGRDTIVSTYPRAAREVRFRFSINGLENEFPGGTEHTIYLRPHHGALVTRVYRFGVEDSSTSLTPEQSATSEDGTARVTFRLDMRPVLRALRTAGHYNPPLGGRIESGAPIHVYVLGEPAPLTWDYGALHPGSALELTDQDGDGVYERTIPIATAYTRGTDAQGRAIWARTAVLDTFPALRSSQRLQDAVYRLSLEELTQLVRSDGTLAAGAKWEGVWTRDVSLSTVLSLAIVAPDAARRSLMAKVDSSGRIIQDTGTGGSWPVSSDRMVWALAAWEVYAATGDRVWLRRAHDIVERSAEADLHAVRDPATGLFDGESSFMDWREQSYPRWMQPADIAESQSLSTNAVQYAAYRALGDMSRALGEPSARWDSVASAIQHGMTTYLWQPKEGWFGEYRYGRVHRSLSPRAEGLGEALASIYGAASRAQRESLMRHAPVMAFGTPSFWPFIPGERFYHDATIWPFVTAYWTWAAAEGGNTTAVRRGLDDATRTTALFLTNKENTVAATGHFEGTALNSDRQLWSVAGTLAGTYRLLFGMRLTPDRLVFVPMVPPSYGGDRTLSRLRYRNAVMTISVHGFGDGVRSVTLDGRPVARAEVPATLSGAHRVEIMMNGRWPAADVHLVPARFAPATPHVTLRPQSGGATLVWKRIPDAVRYVVYENGRTTDLITDTTAVVRHRTGLVECQVLAVSAEGDESFLSEPVRVIAAGGEQLVKPRVMLEHQYAGYSGRGYARLTRDTNTTVSVPVRVTRDGMYAIDVRYANGNGPVNTEDKVAVRTLFVDGETAGVIVMPQRGANRWDAWGWSDPRRVHLTAGTHMVTLTYTPLDANMNRRENTALLDAFRITRLGAVAR